MGEALMTLPEMTEEDFSLLQNKLEFLIRETNKLQQRHRVETGRTFVPHLRFSEFKTKFEIRRLGNGKPERI